MDFDTGSFLDMYFNGSDGAVDTLKITGDLILDDPVLNLTNTIPSLTPITVGKTFTLIHYTG